MSEALPPHVALGVRLSAIMARHQFATDPRPVVEELLEAAAGHPDVLAKEAGIWAGAHEGAPHYAPLTAALAGIPGAREWIDLGRKRAGLGHRTIAPQYPPTPPIPGVGRSVG